LPSSAIPCGPPRPGSPFELVVALIALKGFGGGSSGRVEGQTQNSICWLDYVGEGKQNFEGRRPVCGVVTVKAETWICRDLQILKQMAYNTSILEAMLGRH